MSDIVARIRARFPWPQHADDGLLANEAADEIERLRDTEDANMKHAMVKIQTLRRDLERAESVIAAVGIVAEHECDEVIHPKCWANILAAYHAYKANTE